MRSMPSYAKDAIIAVAPDSEAGAMDLKDIVAQAKVSRQTAQRALDELVQASCRTGKGKRGDAFRHSLPGNRFFSTSNPEGEPWKETN